MFNDDAFVHDTNFNEHFLCDIAIWIDSDTCNLDRWKFVGFATIAGRFWTTTRMTEKELNPFARLQAEVRCQS